MALDVKNWYVSNTDFTGDYDRVGGVRLCKLVDGET
jgi:hypothetical protein